MDALLNREGVSCDAARAARRLQRRLALVDFEDSDGHPAASRAGRQSQQQGGRRARTGGRASSGRAVLSERVQQGAFGRTPLYRAAFGGHLEAVEVLVKLVADPRVCADDGRTPEQVRGRGQKAPVRLLPHPQSCQEPGGPAPAGPEPSRTQSLCRPFPSQSTRYEPYGHTRSRPQLPVSWGLLWPGFYSRPWTLSPPWKQCYHGRWRNRLAPREPARELWGTEGSARTAHLAPHSEFPRL